MLKITLYGCAALAAAAAMLASASNTLAAPVKHKTKHTMRKPVVHYRAAHPASEYRHGQYVIRHSVPPTIINTNPVPRPKKIPATPIPSTPGASPATPPVVPGGSGDTRTPMTPPGVGGTGVPGGPGTLP